jgi:hypothetical protein
VRHDCESVNAFCDGPLVDRRRIHAANHRTPATANRRPDETINLSDAETDTHTDTDTDTDTDTSDQAVRPRGRTYRCRHLGGRGGVNRSLMRHRLRPPAYRA